MWVVNNKEVCWQAEDLIILPIIIIFNYLCRRIEVAQKNPPTSRECYSERNLHKTDLNIYKYKYFVKDSQSYNILSSNIN